MLESNELRHGLITVAIIKTPSLPTLCVLGHSKRVWGQHFSVFHGNYYYTQTNMHKALVSLSLSFTQTHTVQDSTTSTMQILTASQSVSDPRGPNLTAIIPSSVIAAIVVLLVLILITLIVTIVCVKRSTAKVILQVAGDNIDLGDQPAKAPSLKGRSTLPPLLRCVGEMLFIFLHNSCLVKSFRFNGNSFFFSYLYFKYYLWNICS